MLMRFLLVSLMSVLVLLSGCNKPADFDANAQDKTDDTVDTSIDPDGNSEPPLDDVPDELAERTHDRFRIGAGHLVVNAP